MEMEFYFDYLSPHAYLCWPQLKELSERYRVPLHARPISLVGLCEHWEDQSFYNIPGEKNFVFRDCLRAATLLGLPFNPPRVHPFNSYFLLRASLLENAQAAQTKMIDLIWQELWGKGGNIKNVATLLELAQAQGICAATFLVQSESEVSRKLLAIKTDEAIEKGIFRAPSVLIGEELFYGHEQIPLIELYLRGEDPLQSLPRTGTLNPEEIKSPEKISP